MNCFHALLWGRARSLSWLGILSQWFMVFILPTAHASAEESFNFRVILVDNENEAKEILNRLQSEEAFWKLAMDRSLFPNASQGGYVEGADRTELREEFYSVLKKLSSGKVSSIIPVEGQFAILKREAIDSSQGAWKRANKLYTDALRLAAQGEFAAASAKAQGVIVEYPNHTAANYVPHVSREVSQKIVDRSIAIQIFETLLLVQEGFPQKAQENLERLTRSHADLPEIQMVLGEIYMVQGQFSKAISTYEKSLSSPEWATFAHLYIGAASLHRGDIPNALSHYQKAISSDIGLSQAHLGLGLVYLSMGKTKEAIAEIRVALAIDPRLDAGYDHLGMILLALGKTQNAVWAYEKALSIRPDHPTYLSHLGFAYNRMGIFSKAVETLEKAVSIAPEDPMIHNNLAMAYYDNNQMGKAIAHADRARALKYPVHPDFLAKLEPYRKEISSTSR
jgi:tetratricopeptide (TPR) repeat protein